MTLVENELFCVIANPTFQYDKRKKAYDSYDEGGLEPSYLSNLAIQLKAAIAFSFNEIETVPITEVFGSELVFKTYRRQALRAILNGGGTKPRNLLPSGELADSYKTSSLE